MFIVIFNLSCFALLQKSRVFYFKYTLLNLNFAMLLHLLFLYIFVL